MLDKFKKQYWSEEALSKKKFEIKIMIKNCRKVLAEIHEDSFDLSHWNSERAKYEDVRLPTAKDQKEIKKLDSDTKKLVKNIYKYLDSKRGEFASLADNSTKLEPDYVEEIKLKSNKYRSLMDMLNKDLDKSLC